MQAQDKQQHKVSKRAEMFWDRMGDWYGSRIADVFGPVPPADWCHVIDRATIESCKNALERLRKQHPVHPPTFPQFEQLFRVPPRPGEQPPSVQEQLEKHVLSTRKLTLAQLRNWQWLHAGKAWSEEGAAVTGVVIPADGQAPGCRVMVEDMLAGIPA